MKKLLGIVILVIAVPIFLFSLFYLISGIRASFIPAYSTGAGMALMIGFPLFLISLGLLLIAKSLITGRL